MPSLPGVFQLGIIFLFFFFFSVALRWIGAYFYLRPFFQSLHLFSPCCLSIWFFIHDFSVQPFCFAWTLLLVCPHTFSLELLAPTAFLQRDTSAEKQSVPALRPLIQRVSWIYDTKQSDGKVPVMRWGMQSTPSLSLLPSPLWSGMVAPERDISMG